MILRNCLAAALFCFAPTAFADVALPSPDQLINMSINDRLAFYSTLNMLPQDKRDAKMAALKQEIDAMTPAQKQAMQDHFKAEFDAMPADKQDALKKQLGYPQ
jgi:thioredoxin-like negative regulator of GroEL